MPKIGVISLGCAKNLVDSETMIGILNSDDYEITNDANKADVLIVNTCGFIDKAKEESLETIIEMADYKKNGNCKALIVTGCLAERYRDELINDIPEIDALVGTGDFEKISEVVHDSLMGKKNVLYGHQNKIFNNDLPRIISTNGKYAYVKISDGCNNRCTYCIIPELRGRYRSREIEDIYNEVRTLTNNGVKEIVLIAQDTTRFGTDKGGFKLPDLIKRLSHIEKLKWIRLLYCYPEAIDDRLIETIAENEKVCKYIDMPIQHINDTILKRMGRHTSKKQIVELVDKLRKRIPDVVLRTTVIVGFPGETEDQFNELVSFVKESKFEHLGVFEYSQEEGTPAADFPGQISKKVKIQRKDTIMKLQNSISQMINKRRIGEIYDVLVERKGKQYYIGRSYQEAPEIDGLILIDSNIPLNRDFVKVKVKKAFEYDVLGEIIE